MSRHAIAKNLRATPRKMGLVAALVRNRTVSDALVILEHTPRKAAGILAAVIKSAVANAESTTNLKSDDLTIEQILVSPGLSFKGVRPAWRGTAHRINHRTSNATVVLSEQVKSKAKEKV